MEAARSIPGSRRRAARYLACGLGLCALIGAGQLSGGAVALGDGTAGPAIVVELPGGQPQGAFSAEEISKSPKAVPGKTYTLRARPGEAGERVTKAGLPIRGLVEEAGGDPSSFGYLTVPRADGSTAYLPVADFAEPSPFEEGLPALVSASDISKCASFFRPAVEGSEGVNAEDNIVVCGAPLAIVVRNGVVLEVEAAASSTDPNVGTAVDFTARTENPPPGATIAYSWSFGDGSSAEGADVSHAYAQAGSYRFAVTAVGSAESGGGESAPLTIVVGNPPVGAGVGTGPAAPPEKKAKPHGSGGGKKGGSGKKGTGAGKKGSTGSKGGADDHGSRGGSGSGSGKGSKHHGDKGDEGDSSEGSVEETEVPAEPTAPVEPIPFSEVPLPAPEPLPVAPEPLPAIPAPATPDLPTPDPGARGAADRGKHHSAGRETGQTVSGELVADLLEPGAATSGSEGGGSEAGPESFASAPAGSSGGTVPVAALIVAALLGLGVLLEWRRLPLGWHR